MCGEEINHLENLAADGRVIHVRIYEKLDLSLCSGLNWLWSGCSNSSSGIRQWTFKIHNKRGIH
jgi:hypothetical protein